MPNTSVPATEADPLLASTKAEPAYSILGPWRRGTVIDKTVIALGSISAATAGWAVASRFVLYGQALDAMARATLEGTDEIISEYIRLAVVELVATWLQFFVWSRAAVQYSVQLEDSLSSEEKVKHVAYVEGIGSAVYHASITVNALVIAIVYGWDALLVFLLVAGGAGLVGYTVIRSMKKTKTTQNDKDQSMVMGDQDTKQLAYIWSHARAYQLMDAADFALSTVKEVINNSKHKGARTGFVMLATATMYSPLLVALPYSSWKLDRQSSCIEGQCNAAMRLAVVFMATYMGLASVQRVATLVREPEKSMASLTKMFGELPSLNDAEELGAIEWIRKVAAPCKSSTFSLTGSLLAKAVVDILLPISIAYGTAWVLSSPYSDHALQGTRWWVTAVMGCAMLLTGAMNEKSANRQAHVSQNVYKAVVLKVMNKRLQCPEVGEAGVDGTKLATDARMMSMAASSVMEPRDWAVKTSCVVALLVALFVDPVFTVASLINDACTYIQYYMSMKRDKSLYRALFVVDTSSTSIAMMAVDAVIRSLLHIIEPSSSILLLSLQIRLVATQASTLLSTLAVQWLLATCFTVSHVSRFDLSTLVHPTALGAAHRFKLFLSHTAPQDTTPLTIDIRQAGDELSLTVDQRDHTESFALRAGDVRVVQTSTSDAIAQLTEMVLQLVGQAQVMVIDGDAVRIGDTVRENIRVAKPTITETQLVQVATHVGSPLERLDESVPLDAWTQPENSTLRRQVTTARTLLMSPSVLIVEDRGDASSAEELVETARQLRQELHECKMLVLTLDRSRWDGIA